MEHNFVEDRKPLPPSLLWLALGAIIGGMFVVVTPPFTPPDEAAHLFRAYHCSMGRLFATRYGEPSNQFVGDEMPASLEKIRGDCMALDAMGFCRMKPGAMREASPRALDPECCQTIGFTNTALYSPVPYLPASFALGMARCFNARPLQMLYIARGADLAAFLLLVSLAVAVTPIHKWIMTLVALAPMALYLAAAVSADPVTMGLSFLGLALVLRCAVAVENVGRRQLWPLVLTFCLLALSKQIYVVLVLMFFMIPPRQFGGLRRYCLAALAVVGLPVALNVAWWLAVQPLYVPLQPGVEPAAQLREIFRHPLHFVGMTCEAIRVKSVLLHVVGLLGCLDIRLPPNVYRWYWLAMIVTAYCDAGGSRRLDWRIRVVSLAVFGATLATIAVSVYLSWNPVGYEPIVGIQPRYLLPALPLLLLPLRRRPADDPLTRYVPPIATGVVVLAANIAAISAIMWRYYW
jgi:hypothetical protein